MDRSQIGKHIDLYSQSELFQGLRKKEVETLAVNAESRRFGKGSTVLTDESPAGHVYIIDTGDVVISRRTNGGEETILARFISGECFGELDLFSSTGAPVTIRTEADTGLLIFPALELDAASVFADKPDTASKILKNVRFLPTQPESVLPEMLAAADLGLVSLRDSLGELNVPSKVYALMAAARPILAAVPENSEIASLVATANCGIVVSPENPSALSEAVIRAIDGKYGKLEAMGKNGREYLEQRITRESQIDHYHDVLRELTHSR